MFNNKLNESNNQGRADFDNIQNKSFNTSERDEMLFDDEYQNAQQSNTIHNRIMDNSMYIENSNVNIKKMTSEDKFNDLRQLSVQDEFKAQNTPLITQGERKSALDSNKIKGMQQYNDIYSVRSNSHDKASRSQVNSEWEKPYSASKK